jgi:hypothetical protein
MSEVGKVLFGQRSARVVDEAIEKAKELAAVINAADAAELDDLRNKVAHVWQNSVMGLLALRLTQEHHAAAGSALKRLSNK